MLFNSFEFLLLVLVTFVLYYAPFMRRLQVPILIIASFIFYSANQPILLLLLIFSIIINVSASYLVQFGNQKYRRVFSLSGVTLNLGILAFFKYSPLFGRTLFSNIDNIESFLVAIPLPIGISFFTFQGISLVVDTFKSDKIEKFQGMVAKDFWKHTLDTTFFIAFFPQLVAGPIVKAHDFIPQIGTKYAKDIDWEAVFRILIIGYFLKMVIADNLKDHTYWIEYPYYEGLNSFTLIVLLFGYSMQIFADFAGYSLIAIGVAKLFGYALADNFNYPYISKSITEFWRRWHISLSSFLKEYLYIPLGGNRNGNVRTYINLMIVMFLGGLWHGAAWSYAVWGSFHGVALAIERLFKKKINIPSNFWTDSIRMFLTFFFVSFAWLLFKLPDFTYAIGYVQAISGNWDQTINNVSAAAMVLIFVYATPVVLYHFYYLYNQRQLEKEKISINTSGWNFAKVEYIAFGVLLFAIITNSGSAGDFIYFQF